MQRSARRVSTCGWQCVICLCSCCHSHHCPRILYAKAAPSLHVNLILLSMYKVLFTLYHGYQLKWTLNSRLLPLGVLNKFCVIVFWRHPILLKEDDSDLCLQGPPLIEIIICSQQYFQPFLSSTNCCKYCREKSLETSPKFLEQPRGKLQSYREFKRSRENFRLMPCPLLPDQIGVSGGTGSIRGADYDEK